MHESYNNIWMSHVTKRTDAQHDEQLSSILRSCVLIVGMHPGTNGSRHTYERVMSHVLHVTYVHESCRTCDWVMSHMHPGMWLIHICAMTDVYCTPVTRLIHMCDMTHLYVWHAPSICVAWLIHACAMTDVCVLHPCHITHSFVCMTYRRHASWHQEPWHRYEWVLTQIWMSSDTDMNEFWHRYEWVLTQM